MTQPWTKKYEPKSAAEVAGQRSAVLAVQNFVQQYPRVRKRALLLFGPTGVGKTEIVKAIANQMNLELIELNASDYRNADAIKTVLMPAVQQMSLFGTKKLILVDEIDGLSGQQDRGGVAAIIDVVKESKFPILMTANDAYSDKLKSLRKECDLVELKPLTDAEIVAALKDIAAREGVKYDMAALQTLAASANGDLRAAINDMQMLTGKDKELTKEELVLWGREQKESLFTMLRFVFKSFDPAAVTRMFDYVEDDLEEMMLWLDHNLPAEYSKKEDLAFAYRSLADSDRFLSRIRRRQHWRFFVYAKYLALVGVQQAKTEASRKFVMHQRPDLLLKFFIASAKRKKMQALANDYSEMFHTSGKRLQQAFWPYYSYVVEKGKSFANLEIE
jgi:replication factor C large subunit